VRVPALRHDLVIEQGSTYRLSVPVLDDTSEPLDITGWTVRGQIRLTHASPTVAYDLGPHLAIAGTAVEVTIPAEDSSLWTWCGGVYDVELVDPDGNPTRLIQGNVVVSPEVTR
jgi:hypothetical protein